MCAFTVWRVCVYMYVCVCMETDLNVCVHTEHVTAHVLYNNAELAKGKDGCRTMIDVHVHVCIHDSVIHVQWNSSYTMAMQMHCIHCKTHKRIIVQFTYSAYKASPPLLTPTHTYSTTTANLIQGCQEPRVLPEGRVHHGAVLAVDVQQGLNIQLGFLHVCVCVCVCV